MLGDAQNGIDSEAGYADGSKCQHKRKGGRGQCEELAEDIVDGGHEVLLKKIKSFLFADFDFLGDLTSLILETV